MDPTLGILVSSPGYAKRLADYFNPRRDVGLRAVAFRTTDELKGYLSTKSLTLLLSDDISNREITADKCRFCYLSDDPEAEPSGDMPDAIFKFRSASAIVRSVLSLNPETSVSFNHIYTVFSPASNETACRYAYALCTRLSGEGRTLFLSWELFGAMGREKATQEQRTISDLLFTARKNETGMRKLMSGLPSRDGWDYFAGTEYYADLWQYSPGEMERLIRECKQYGGYENIVFLCGFFSPGVEALLECSDVIYLVSTGPEGRDVRSNEFIRQMKYAGKQAILTRIKEVCL